MDATTQQDERRHAPYLTPAGAWAFSLGTTIGWGSLVVTSSSYLSQAGPWGSIGGLLVGLLVMLVVARNYHYMINCFPDSGGAYTYTKEIFGHDHGFLTAWFLCLTYIAIFWANATSLPLFAHYFIGDAFKFGFCYRVFGYDVYLGEALLSIAAIMLTALACSRSRKNVMRVMIGMGVLLSVAILACFFSAMGGSVGASGAFEPGFIPDKTAWEQILHVACISPWAFIGFENISHSVEEFSFNRNRSFRIMTAALLTATVLYICVFMLSVSAHPARYANWMEYIADLKNLDGLEGLPAFYAAHHYLGDMGVSILMFALLSLIVTSLIGNTLALSRLLRVMAEDKIIPHRFSRINKYGIPGNAVFLVAGISVFIPFFGRTAIGWIVDVTTIGATIIYGFVSACALKVARLRGDKIERTTGFVGVAVMVGFGLYLLLPSLFLSRVLEQESYFLFVLWGIMGFLYFRVLLKRDVERRYGRSVVVWITLLSLVMFVSFVWMNQSLTNTAENAMSQVHEHYHGDEESPLHSYDDGFIQEQMVRMDKSGVQTMLVAAGLLGLASALLLSNFAYVSSWAQDSERELDLTRGIIYTDPLTGLPSMARFNELAAEEAAAIKEQGGHPIVLAFDLVGMKGFNTQHGRLAGDELLRAFADVLKEEFGEESCSRFSEDHFYAVTSHERVDQKIQNIFDTFQHVNDGNVLPVHAGIYVCTSDDDIATVGFDRARSACDVDKKTWQSSATWYHDDMHDQAQRRFYVLDHLDKAIEERWIRPYYQAVVCTKTEQVCHEEALARWIDPVIGFLSPGEFIPVLEEAGLLHKADLHMLDCVLEDLVTKRELGMEVFPVSVNISLRDLGQLDVSQEIIRRVDAAGISHDLVVIEFTESAASEDPQLFKTEVDELRAVGFEVWMDDFGSGYSSLNSLKEFDFDVAKLDMVFLREERGQKTWDIIEGIVRIAQKLGMRMVAEGVETEDQVRRLTAIGCDMLQGYYYSKPLSLDDVIARFESGTGAKF